MFSLPVLKLLEDKSLNLKLVAGKKGLGNVITIPRIQKPGLALAGDTAHIYPGRIQVLGTSEIRYLESVPPKKRQGPIEAICKAKVACMVITNGLLPPDPLKAQCQKNDVPLMLTKLLTPTFVNRATTFLDNSMAQKTTAHGVLLDVFGVGILIIGKSGIGKSECALDLVLRGHRLVADDIVNINREPPSSLYGTGSEIIRYHMEIRGLGIINIKDLFGISAVRQKKLIELAVELTDWDPAIEYDRLGVDEQRYTILDVNIPHLQIPVRPGRNIAALIEVAARNQLLKRDGVFSAKHFQEKLSQHILTGLKSE